MNQPDNRRIMALDLFSPFLFGIINNWTNFSFYHNGTWILRNQVWANSRKKVGICDRAKIIIPYTQVRDQYWEEVALRHGPINYRLHRWEKCDLLLYNMTTRWEKCDILLYTMTTRWEKCDILLYNMTTRWEKCDLLLHNMTTRWEKCDLLLHNMTTRWEKCDILWPTFVHDHKMGIVWPTFVQHDHYLLKGLHEVHVVVAVLLYPDQEGEFGFARLGHSCQEGAVGLQVLQGLLSHQLLLLIPLHGCHNGAPYLLMNTPGHYSNASRCYFAL